MEAVVASRAVEAKQGALVAVAEKVEWKEAQGGAVAALMAVALVVA